MLEEFQLVKFVLMHIHLYWSSIFILPRRVLKDVVAICRNSYEVKKLIHVKLL